MDRNKQIILVFFLLMAMISSLALAAAGKPKLKPATVAEPVAPVVAVFPEKKELMDLIAEDNASSDIVLEAAWGDRNPFDSAAIQSLPAPAPVKTIESINTKFFLAGILWNVARPSAIINDQVVAVDSVISGMTVKEIKEGIVILSDGTNQLVLPMHK